jgi:dolichol-phosphate mannosyltransferase
VYSLNKITVIVPTYNEAENLPKLVSALFSLPLPELDLLIVDDNSPDGTGQLAEELGKQYPGRIDVLHRPGKLGLGRAYIAGFRHALKQGAEAIFQMDADFSHPIEKIPEMVAAIEGCDVVLGSRYVKGGSLDENWPFLRKALSAWGNFYARTILGLPIYDVTGGFRLWRREVLEGIPLERVKSNGYIFQVEMAYIARKLGFHFREVPIYFAERVRGKSKMNFRIQVEAAFRVWFLLGMYRDLDREIRI